MKFTIPTTILLLASSVFATLHATNSSRDLSISVDNADDTPGSAGDWTVIVDNDDPRSLSEMIQEMGIDQTRLKYVYNNTAFKGFAGSLSTKHVSKMSIMSGISTFERDQKIKLSDVQTNAPWGLQRVSQGGAIPNPPQDSAGIAAFDFQYQFEGQTAGLGKNVDIYVIDTGVNVKHIDFDGRASFLFAFDGVDADEEGHGYDSLGVLYCASG
jgi:cerevisin